MKNHNWIFILVSQHPDYPAGKLIRFHHRAKKRGNGPLPFIGYSPDEHRSCLFQPVNGSSLPIDWEEGNYCLIVSEMLSMPPRAKTWAITGVHIDWEEEVRKARQSYLESIYGRSGISGRSYSKYGRKSIDWHGRNISSFWISPMIGDVHPETVHFFNIFAQERAIKNIYPDE